ncbi:uncharacterized protein [Physcomitrium patens]|uniref:uncharacterized protein isoform X7 n=1 Tax=Physcomitrium patens TaxID=3218 RepID=UPI003CCC9796
MRSASRQFGGFLRGGIQQTQPQSSQPCVAEVRAVCVRLSSGASFSLQSSAVVSRLSSFTSTDPVLGI